MTPSTAEKRRAKGQGNMADLARLLGVSEVAVKKAITEGRVERRGDGWLDLESAAAAFRATSTGSRNGNGGARPAQYNDVTGEQLDEGEDGGETLASARTRKERALADKAEVDAQRARAEVVFVADVVRTWASLTRSVRERLTAIPDHSGPALGLTAEQVAGLRAEITRALLELPQDPP